VDVVAYHLISALLGNLLKAELAQVRHCCYGVARVLCYQCDLSGVVL
jgi:hypothetical protein